VVSPGYLREQNIDLYCKDQPSRRMSDGKVYRIEARVVRLNF